MKTTVGLAGAMVLTGAASADVLWDQSNYDIDAPAIVDQEFGDFATYSSYMVMDVLTADAGWNINSVTTYFTNQNGGWLAEGLNMARLNIFEKSAGLPLAGDDPGSGMLVSATLTDLGDGTLALEASGLDIDLSGGAEYWIGLTASGDFGVFGQEFHRGAPILGDDTAWRNPGGAFGFGPDWQTTVAVNPGWVGVFDAAFKVEGVLPSPGALTMLGLAGLLGRRRRRD